MQRAVGSPDFPRAHRAAFKTAWWRDTGVGRKEDKRNNERRQGGKGGREVKIDLKKDKRHRKRRRKGFKAKERKWTKESGGEGGPFHLILDTYAQGE